MEKPTFREALLFWLKLGFISFGGPTGQIAIMREFLVEKKRWISQTKFLHALNYCYLLPGPEAQQLATYTGWLLHGTKGGLAAGILFVLPSVFILLTLSILYVKFGQIPWVYAFFDGLKPAVVAIVAVALHKIVQKSLRHFSHYLIALASFIAITFLHIRFPLIVLAAILLGLILIRLRPTLFDAVTNARAGEDESPFYLNTHSIIPGTDFRIARLLRQSAFFIVLWFAPILLFRLLANDFHFWQTMSIFFTKAAFVTFGGAYAVLPYVAQVSVNQFHWLSSGQMIDGFALGETTPGPLIMILAFVGFMAGFNQNHFSLLSGTIGLLTTTYYTFLPCFLYIFAGAPIIEQTQTNRTVRSILSIVTAAVVGVVLHLTVYFGQTVIFPQALSLAQLDLSSLFWIIVSFVALTRAKVDMTLWIGISALYGLLHHFLLA
jgi:chromate transporter